MVRAGPANSTGISMLVSTGARGSPSPSSGLHSRDGPPTFRVGATQVPIDSATAENHGLSPVNSLPVGRRQPAALGGGEFKSLRRQWPAKAWRLHLMIRRAVG
jgi:hypothetical protein